MSPQRTVTVTLPDGRRKEAVEVEVESANERWSEFKLADGATLRAKISLVNITRVTDEWDPVTGQPVYQINASPQFALIDIPEALIRGGRRQ
jgi:hypothetical protein